MPTPTFPIPSSSQTVRVRIIDSTAKICVPLADFTANPVKGHSHLNCPAYCFIIEHETLNQAVLFDLGVRKDWHNLAAPVTAYMQASGTTVGVDKDVKEILVDNNIETAKISAIIWSHWHWDHIGDPSRFPSSTKLIVGPGFKQTFLPGFPANPQSPVLETDFAGREVEELDFSDSKLKIGRFDAIDYFGDGSFYLLDAPGHTIGHLNGLARVTLDPDTFILMGADSCHHSAEMRPSEHVPLPPSIHPHPLMPQRSAICPGSIFTPFLRGGNCKIPFYGAARPGLILSDPDIVEATIAKLGEADSDDTVFVVIAHDEHLADIIDIFPLAANDFYQKKWKQKARWTFLCDFQEALKAKSTVHL